MDTSKTTPIANESLWLLTELTSELSTATDLESLQRLLIKGLRWLFDFDCCTLAIRGEADTNRFWLLEIAESTDPLELTPQKLVLNANWPSRVLLEDKPYFIEDLGKLPPSIQLPTDPECGISSTARSLIVIPLHFNGRVFGSFNLSSNQPDAYSTGWRNLATMLAFHLSGKLGSLLAQQRLIELPSLPATPKLSEISPNPENVLVIPTVENQLPGALDRGEFKLYYQPLVEIVSGKIVGAEALIRWQHPQLGMISPAKFIPMAEESGLILSIDRWVLDEACHQNLAWQQAGYEPLKMSVNISAMHFEQPDFVELVTQTLEKSGLAPRYLELELTESLLIRDYKAVALKLSQIRALGVEVAIDDFGTGYASFTHLQHLPADTLKIDQSFIRVIAASSNPGNHVKEGAIVQAIIMMAHSVGMRTVAEGVETEAQLNLLRQLDCDVMQGYLFSRPRPVAEFEPLLTFKELDFAEVAAD